ncbi:nucleotidyl transferase AbiEii/AbiGii toxin family protein [Thermicanus aegyptius]|uniref:nucleotidyl transferase AbiEii/AbiGii toxin family protein n=1 Tax=Thermicanus aegyptius TaxID=94009 RepID=UPI00146FAFF9|nr:nucleotidyl transferase AbiEii/AbiGii toxin family protein [Thermicanus aegyptius]
MFWNVIDQTGQFVLRRILESPPVKNCYLAGGTALALLLGHRESIDFDWFTPHLLPTRLRAV